MLNRLLVILLAICLQAPYILADDDVEMAQLTFNVDDASRVEISVMGEPLSDIQSGPNTVEVYQWSNIQISPKEGCALVSVTDSQGNSLNISNGVVAFMVYEITPETYTIVSERMSETSFTVSVDDPSKVKVIDSNYQPITLTEGINALQMSTGKFPLMIGAATYGQELYKVTLDGVDLECNYGSYIATPQEGSVINIVANFPDIDCDVNFVYPEGITNFFTCVTVNGEEKDIAGNQISVKCGDSVALYYNASCWDSEDAPVTVSINGVDVQWFWSGYKFVVKENTTVTVTQAQAVEMIMVDVEVDKPTNVNVYRGNKDYYKDLVYLKSGLNSIQLPKDDAKLVITNVEIDGKESRITGITINGTPQTVSYYNEVELEDLEEDDYIRIFTSDDFGNDDTPVTPDLATVPFTLNPAPGAELEEFEVEMGLKDGYEELDVAEMMVFLYKDGEEVCGVYADPSDDYSSVIITPELLSLEAGDYDLMFMAGSITCEGDEYFSNPQAYTFRYTIVEKATDPVTPDLSELPFTINPEPGSNVESLEIVLTLKDGYDELDVAEMMVFIYKDGQQVCGVYADASDDYTTVKITPESSSLTPGNYDFIFQAGSIYCEGEESFSNPQDYKFSYTLVEPNEIQTVNAENESGDIYDLSGVKRNGSLSSQPSGIYILNGKKILK